MFGLIGAGARMGIKGAFRGGMATGGALGWGNVGRMAGGASLYMGAGAAANVMERDQIPGYSIGGAYPFMARGIGLLGGGGMFATGAVRGLGSAAGKAYGSMNRMDLAAGARSRLSGNRGRLSYNKDQIAANRTQYSVMDRRFNRETDRLVGEINTPMARPRKHTSRKNRQRLKGEYSQRWRENTAAANQNEIAAGQFRGENLGRRAELGGRSDRIRTHQQSIRNRYTQAKGGDMGAMQSFGVGKTGAGRFIGGMQNFSSARLMGKGAIFGAKMAGAASYGVVKAPGVVAADSLRMLRFGLDKGYRNSRTMFSFADEGLGFATGNPLGGMGSRAVGWGALAGAGTVAFNLNVFGGEMDPTRGIAGAGTQFYDPSSGRKPRRMMDSAAHHSTVGLTQSLHRNR
jgi:hypothetical protein